MAMPPDHAAANQITTLLTIPGEIRNLIYEYAVAEVLSESQTDLLSKLKFDNNIIDYEPRCDPILLILKSGHVHDWPALHRSCLGLTQMCRELRQEFLPIHQARLTVSVKLEQLSDYTAVFIDGLNIANLVVVLKSEDFPSGSYPSCDITELIPLCDRDSDVKLRLGWPVGRKLSAVLSSPSDYPDIFQFMKTKVKAVTIHFFTVPSWSGDSRHLNFDIRLEVREEYAEDWMKNGSWSIPEYRRLLLWRRELKIDLKIDKDDIEDRSAELIYPVTTKDESS